VPNLERFPVTTEIYEIEFSPHVPHCQRRKDHAQTTPLDICICSVFNYWVSCTMEPHQCACSNRVLWRRNTDLSNMHRKICRLSRMHSNKFQRPQLLDLGQRKTREKAIRCLRRKMDQSYERVRFRTIYRSEHKLRMRILRLPKSKCTVGWSNCKQCPSLYSHEGAKRYASAVLRFYQHINNETAYLQRSSYIHWLQSLVKTGEKNENQDSKVHQ